MKATDLEQPLEPCPFCGSDETGFSEPPIPWLVICGNCGAEGPYADKRKDAHTAWNTRAIQSTRIRDDALSYLEAALEAIVRETGDRGDGLIDWQRCVNRIQAIARAALTTAQERKG